MKNLSSEALPKKPAPRRIEAFIYRDSGAAAAAPALDLYEDSSSEAPLDGISEEQAQAREAQARGEAYLAARREAEQSLSADLEQRLQTERGAVLAALREFDEQRQDYFRQLEREVVQLALAIARKVLQREAQIDPLLLAGTVRVALDQLAGGAAVELHVPASKMPQWEELLRREPEFACRPQLRADPVLEPAGCRVQTDTGATDLSLDSQLREVEQGFLDLLNRRTRVAGETAPRSTPLSPQ